MQRLLVFMWVICLIVLQGCNPAYIKDARDSDSLLAKIDPCKGKGEIEQVKNKGYYRTSCDGYTFFDVENKYFIVAYKHFAILFQIHTKEQDFVLYEKDRITKEFVMAAIHGQPFREPKPFCKPSGIMVINKPYVDIRDKIDISMHLLARGNALSLCVNN